MSMPEIRFENVGTVAIVQPLTGRAWEWVRENVNFDTWQLLGGGIAMEPRYIPDVAAAAKEAGFVVA